MVETKPQNIPPPGEGGEEKPEVLPTFSLEIGFDFVALLVTIFFVALLSTAAIFGFRFLVIERTLNEQEQEIASLENELAQPGLKEVESKLSELASGIDRIKPFLEDPVRYGELFWTLRKVTERGVRWTSLGFNENKELSLVGQAAGWGNVARQLVAFKQNDKFTKVELSSAALEQDESGSKIAFSLTLTVETSQLVPPKP